MRGASRFTKKLAYKEHWKLLAVGAFSKTLALWSKVALIKPHSAPARKAGVQAEVAAPMVWWTEAKTQSARMQRKVNAIVTSLVRRCGGLWCFDGSLARDQVEKPEG